MDGLSLQTAEHSERICYLAVNLEVESVTCSSSSDSSLWLLLVPFFPAVFLFSFFLQGIRKYRHAVHKASNI